MFPFKQCLKIWRQVITIIKGVLYLKYNQHNTRIHHMSNFVIMLFNIAVLIIVYCYMDSVVKTIHLSSSSTEVSHLVSVTLSWLNTSFPPKCHLFMLPISVALFNVCLQSLQISQPLEIVYAYMHCFIIWYTCCFKMPFADL